MINVLIKELVVGYYAADAEGSSTHTTFESIPRHLRACVYHCYGAMSAHNSSQSHITGRRVKLIQRLHGLNARIFALIDPGHEELPLC